MGFIDGGKGREPVPAGECAYTCLATGDLASAWAMLSRIPESSPAWAFHCRAICRLHAGRAEEALEDARKAFRLCTEGVPQKPLDPVGEVLAGRYGGSPPPMAPSLFESNPTLAGILARWLLCVCLLECGHDAEAEQTAAPLERYGIKPVRITRED